MRNPLAALEAKTHSLARLSRHVGLTAPAMLVIAAAGAWFAVTQVQKAAAAGTQSTVADQQKAVKPRLDRTSLDAGGYSEAAKVLANLNPNVSVRYVKEKDALQVSVTDPAMLPEWIFLLSTIQVYRTGLIWNAERLCLKKCDSGDAAIAELKAYTQKISIPQ